MKFSICIPNYNYARYLKLTLKSALEQSHRDLEVLVADNCSTDDSVKVVQGFDDPRLKLKVNSCNVGFARNLDMAASMAEGDVCIMLSSDDLILPEALTTYAQLLEALPDAEHSVLSSTWNVIDSEGAFLHTTGPDLTLWHPEERNAELSRTLGCDVYLANAADVLKRCVSSMRNPFNFAATAYPRALYRSIEGYGGGRLYNPDKWFNWRLLNVARCAVFVDRPLFAYRWHASNQAAQQAKAGALKYLLDDYASTIEIDAQMLKQAQVERGDIEKAFVEFDIARHGLATLAKDHRLLASRILLFGLSSYPQHTLRNWKSWALASLLALGPVGQKVAHTLYTRRAAANGREIE